MNFYKHHLGDYDGATAHLSWDEDMAYTRLLRAYYRRERPIGEGEAYRLARASSKAQRAAVDTVLAEFFDKRADGWHNKRADEETQAYQAQREHNRVVGPLGGRPKKTQMVSENNQSGFENKPKHNPNQEPRTKNHKPEESKSKPQSDVGLAPDAHPPDDNDSNRETMRKLHAQAVALIEFLNEKTGRNYRPVKENVKPIVSRLQHGASVADIRAVIAKKCREWKGDPKMDEYLRPKTLFNATNFANYEGELGAA